MVFSVQTSTRNAFAQSIRYLCMCGRNFVIKNVKVINSIGVAVGLLLVVVLVVEMLVLVVT